MEETPPSRVTQLLIDWGQGDERAYDEVLPPVYEELRRSPLRT